MRHALLGRADSFATAMTEKLLTYALGRLLEHYDMPAVRRIVDEAESANYRFSSIVLGIVNSTPFRMKAKGPEGLEDEAHEGLQARRAD
jgi:hypothetical protein